MTKPKRKKGQGHKKSLCEQWTDEQKERIQQHRKRIADEMRRIKKAGLMLSKAPVRKILEAGVELSDERCLTPAALEKMAVESDKESLESAQMNDRQRRILKCALAYAKMGWQVLPVHTLVDGKCTCGKHNCSSAGKHPATANGVKDASTDSEQLKKWFGSGRLLNIGIAAGAGSKLAILDIDPKNGGNETAKQYKIPSTLEVITGSGGRHYYFADPDGAVGNSVGKLGDGIDVRGNNGYVVAPPSLHASGKEYRWAIDPRAVDIAAFPKWMDGKKQECRNVGIQECREDGPIAEGKRNETLCSVAGSMRRQGCDEAVIYDALIDINERRCKPPVAFDELRKIAQSVARYAVEPPQASQVPQDGIVLNDDHPETIAAAFHTAATNAYRFNPIDGWSIVADDKYCRIDEGQVAVALRQWLNNVYIKKLIAKEWTPIRYKKNGSKIRDILAELGAMVAVYIPTDKHAPASLSGTLDTNHIIAANNGLLNITALPPKRRTLTKDFYTLNYLPFDYDPKAQCPQWQAFLESVFTQRRLSKKTEWNEKIGDFVEQYETIPDDLAIGILGEWFGYLLSKETRLQKIFGLIGERRSGKSTIGRVLRALNGAANTASPTLNSLATEFGLQGLVNKTIAVIGDANAAGRSGDAARAVERLKSISGEDGQQINRKNKDFIEVEKLPIRFLLIANKMQDLRDSTGALASRFNILVTTQSFLGCEDHHLADRLMTELPGIFNWAMDGLGRLRQRGYIKDHPAGVDARDEFEQMSSPMKAFIEDWCVVDESTSVPVDVLWMAHGKWADENGNHSYSKRKFIVEIKGACGGVKRTRLRLDPASAQWTYKWDIGDGDNRISMLTGIDLAQGYKTAWSSGTKWDSGTDNGTGYPPI